MKVRLLIIVIISGLLFQCGSPQSEKTGADALPRDTSIAQPVKRQLSYIRINYMDLNLESVRSVNCDELNVIDTSEAFCHTALIKKGSTEFRTFDSLYSSFIDDTEKPGSIDVRVHIDNYDDKNEIMSTICMDAFGHFYFMNEGKYKKNEALKMYIIDNIIPIEARPITIDSALMALKKYSRSQKNRRMAP